MIQLFKLLTVHGQPVSEVTVNCPPPAPEATAALVAEIVNEQGWPFWRRVSVWFATVTRPVREAPLGLPFTM